MLKSMACTNLTLDAGDVLYLPRGTVHVATTSNTTSIHMTYRLETKGHTWADLKYEELRVDEDSPWLLNLGQMSRATSSYGYKQREVG
jgi:cupin superfamily acireductone dioxygenase involved in methionine salvage